MAIYKIANAYDSVMNMGRTGGYTIDPGGTIDFYLVRFSLKKWF